MVEVVQYVGQMKAKKKNPGVYYICVFSRLSEYPRNSELNRPT